MVVALHFVVEHLALRRVLRVLAPRDQLVGDDAENLRADVDELLLDLESGATEQVTVALDACAQEELVCVLACR